MNTKINKNLLLVLVVAIVLTPFSTVLAKYENPYDRYLFEKIKSVREFFKSKPIEKKEKEAQAVSEKEDLRQHRIWLALSDPEKYEAELALDKKRASEDPKNIAEKARAATKASEDLNDKAKEVYAIIKDFAGSSFDDQCKNALDILKKNPNSLKLQLDMCDTLMAYADKLYNSFNEADKAGLSALRDRAVQGFKTVSELKAAEAQKYQNRANSEQGASKVRYEQLSTACLNFSKAYELRAQNYQKVKIDEQMLEVKGDIEYLDCVKEVLIGLKEFIKTIQADEKTFQQLLDTQKSLASLQKSLLTFSEVVLDGALRGSGDLSDLSIEQTQESKP